MNGVIYARYSSDNQREESIEGQLRDCKAFAEKNGIDILNTYIDRALTAKSDNRPDFQKMIKDAEKDLFEVIIVWKLDRFARNRYDSAIYKGMLKKQGVKVVSATEPISDDSTGILLEAMLEGYAEFYSAELSEKVCRGMTDNALKGKYNGGILPLGYAVGEDGHFLVEETTAPVVLDIFQLYNSGLTLKEVSAEIEKRGIRARCEKVIGPSSITKILRNRRYIGEYRFKETVVQGAVPQIVPNSLFDAVQKRLDGNMRAPARFKAKDDMYLLSTKLFCGSCGAYMIGESGKGKGGKVFRYYKCASAKKNKGCMRKAISKKDIEDTVITFVRELTFDSEIMDKIADMIYAAQKQEHSEMPLLKKRLADTQKAIDNMLNAIQQGIFNELTKERLDTLNDTKNEIEVDIAKAAIAETMLTKEQIRFWLSRFKNLDTSNEKHRRMLVDTFVNAVYIFDDKTVLTFNWKDGTETVTLREIECSDLEAYASPLTLPFGCSIAGLFLSGIL